MTTHPHTAAPGGQTMSEFKTTWAVERDDSASDDPSLRCISDNEDNGIAYWVPEEHAHLIAAAPQLLEALRDAVDAWDTHNQSGDGMQGDWVSDARAAIAKAEAQSDV